MSGIFHVSHGIRRLSLALWGEPSWGWRWGQQGGGSLCVMYWASVLFTGCCVMCLSVKIDKASTFPVLVLFQ